MLGQVLEEISNERNDFIIVKIDVDENPDLAKLNGVMSVPTLILFKNGNVVARQSGFMPKEILNKWIDENK